MLKQIIKRLIRLLPPRLRQPALFSRLYIQNVLALLKLKRTTDWVCALKNFDPKARLRYAEEVFEDYFQHSELSKASLNGKRVLEIGTGENFSVALYSLAHGATAVVSIDRFPSLVPDDQQVLVYRELVSSLKRTGISTDSFIRLEGGRFTINNDRFRYLPGTALESVSSILDEPFDIIVSRAVLEHIYDLPKAFSSMDKLLKPGGVMIHEVDFRDHGIFSGFGLHPLTFLTYSEAMWKGATNRLGAPNRELENSFRDLLDQHGYNYRILKILAVGSDKKFHEANLREGFTHDPAQSQMIRSIRHRLADRFKNLPEEDLLTSGIFLTARKSQ